MMLMYFFIEKKNITKIYNTFSKSILGLRAQPLHLYKKKLNLKLY